MLDTGELELLKSIALQNYRKLLFFATFCTLLVALRLHPRFFPSEYQSRAFLLFPNFKYLQAANFPKEMYKGYGTASRLQLENLVAFLKSHPTRQRVVHKCHLLAAYGLEGIPDAHKRNKLLQDYYEDKVRVQLQGSAKIELQVYDTDPYRAVKITQVLIQMADSFLEKTAARALLLSAQMQSIEAMQKRIRALQDSLFLYYRLLNIYPVHKTPENLNRLLLEKAFTHPYFPIAYDKMLGYAYEMKRLEKRLTSLQNDQSFRRAEFQGIKLMQLIAPAVPTLEVARPPRIFLCILAFVLSMGAGYSFLLALTPFRPLSLLSLSRKGNPQK